MRASGLSKYHDQVNVELKRLYGVTWEDLGEESDDPRLAFAYDDKESPKEFALWYGEKYDLTLKSELMLD